MKKHIKYMVLIVLLPWITACENDPDVKPLVTNSAADNTLVVITGDVSDISGNSATCRGAIINNAGYAIEQCGIVCATEPDLGGELIVKESANTSEGGFTIMLNELMSGTTYYVRSYAFCRSIGQGVILGAEKTFTTPCVENGHEFVDLGLSVKWATCNVGAKKPQQYGDYYSWGQTAKSTSEYDIKTEYYYEDKEKLTSYSDVATAKWGGRWRMPTDAEMAELIDNCTWEWTTKGKKHGYLVISTINNNSIFLPAAGCYYSYSSIRDCEDEDGYYWTSVGYYSSVFAMYFYNTGRWMGTYDKLRKCSVRPVCP